MRAMCASVSALCTRTGRFPMRNGVPLSGRKTGSARWASIQFTSADSSPATKRSGGRATSSTRSGVPRRAALTYGVLHGRGDSVPTDRDAHHYPACLAHGGEELRSIEHEVRSAGEEHLVLVTRRFTLHGVDDERPPVTV